MARQRIVKYPPKRGQISRSKIERAVREVLEARGGPIEPKRDTYKYHLKRGNKVIRSGITNDLDRREKEHQRNYGKMFMFNRLETVQPEKGRGNEKEATAWHVLVFESFGFPYNKIRK